MASIILKTARREFVMLGLTIIAAGFLYYALYKDIYLFSLFMLFGLIFLLVSKLRYRKTNTDDSYFPPFVIW